MALAELLGIDSKQVLYFAKKFNQNISKSWRDQWSHRTSSSSNIMAIQFSHPLSCKHFLIQRRNVNSWAPGDSQFKWTWSRIDATVHFLRFLGFPWLLDYLMTSEDLTYGFFNQNNFDILQPLNTNHALIHFNQTMETPSVFIFGKKSIFY